MVLRLYRLYRRIFISLIKPILLHGTRGPPSLTEVLSGKSLVIYNICSPEGNYFLEGGGQIPILGETFTKFN